MLCLVLGGPMWLCLPLTTTHLFIWCVGVRGVVGPDMERLELGLWR
jgi:hypothetical protein